AVALYLCYSCSLQSLFPPRPLLRDADRFLTSLAFPLALLAVAGLAWAVSLWRPAREWVARRPVAVACAACVGLALCSSREFFNRGYIPEFHDYLEQIPPGTPVFTHYAMRSAAFLANPERAAQLQWNTKSKILERSESR